jgi:adenylate cyclase
MLRPAAATLFVLALSSLYLFIAVREFGAAGAWLPLLIPLGVQAPLALFGGTLLNYRDARRERKRIKEAFGYFLSDKIVDRIVETVGPLTAADQLVYGVCLVTDVEKYTTLAETMSPRELGQLMNEYYAELFKPVERLGGVVNEVVGDSMMAIWAGSSAETSMRRQACETALEILEAVERFNRARAGKPALVTRFGLHSGQLLLGSIGASKHYEYQATGDMVNTASRIEGLSKYLGTRVLASEATVEGLTGFLTRPVGTFVLAGKSAAVPIVELGGSAENADPRRSLLYERFALALKAYESRAWHEAVRLFSEIIRSSPDDGPSQFYLRRCEAYLLNPPDESWDPTVRLEHK